MTNDFDPAAPHATRLCDLCEPVVPVLGEYDTACGRRAIRRGVDWTYDAPDDACSACSQVLARGGWSCPGCTDDDDEPGEPWWPGSGGGGGSRHGSSAPSTTPALIPVSLRSFFSRSKRRSG